MIEAQYAGQSLSNVPSITIAIPYELDVNPDNMTKFNPYYHGQKFRLNPGDDDDTTTN